MENPELDLRRPRPRLVMDEESIEQRLRETQIAIESRAMQLPAGARRGLLLEIAGQVLVLRARLERLLAA